MLAIILATHIGNFVKRFLEGAFFRMKRKKSLTRGHVKDIGSIVGIRSYRGQGYEGAMSGDCFENFWHLHLYVMAVLSRARVVRFL
jgi:hypothetical protein